jgi:flagellar biosynthetic protein FlhB
MAEGQDESQKTEKPTAKRLEDARKKGDLAKSQDVASWFTLLAGAALVAGAGPLMQSVANPLVSFLDHPHAFSVQGQGGQHLLEAVLMSLAGPLAIMFGVLLVAGAAGHILQAMPVWTAEKIKPKLDKISPIEGFKRLFGAEGWMNLLKAILKMLAVGAAVTFAIWPALDSLTYVGGRELAALPRLIHEIAGRLFLAALIAVGLVAALDFIWQRFSFEKRMRMSLQDIKDETKNTEGDPIIKARLRQIRMERARRRMMAEVPKATVIVTNPTHYAVALRYVRDETPAPICVAKGVDAVALKIREVGKEADVPIIENPPLARALFATAEIDQPIPREHFEAVAKVIGIILSTRRGAGRGAN